MQQYNKNVFYQQPVHFILLETLCRALLNAAHTVYLLSGVI